MRLKINKIGSHEPYRTLIFLDFDLKKRLVEYIVCLVPSVAVGLIDTQLSAFFIWKMFYYKTVTVLNQGFYYIVRDI